MKAIFLAAMSAPFQLGGCVAVLRVAAVLRVVAVVAVALSLLWLPRGAAGVRGPVSRGVLRLPCGAVHRASVRRDALLRDSAGPL
ncbi:hypothetical protein GCM10009642_48360 [Nocardiopsis metallicus]